MYIYLRRCGTKANVCLLAWMIQGRPNERPFLYKLFQPVILRHSLAVFTQFPYFSTSFHSTSSCAYSTFSLHRGGGAGLYILQFGYILQRFVLHFPILLLSFPLPTITFPAFSRYFIRFLLHHFSLHFLRLMLFPCIFSYFCSHFLCLPSHFLHFHCILYDFFPHFSLYFFRFTLFSSIFPCFCFHFLCLPSHFLHFHCIFYGFYYIIVPLYSATKMADLGGIDTPPSTNCLAVHNPAKHSTQSPLSQPESEIWSRFVHHSPPTPPMLTSFANSN